MRIRPALLLVIALPACATAQASPDSVKERNDCRLAAQVLSTGQPRPRLQWAAQVILAGHPEPHENWAWGAIGRCDETGVPTLAAAWQRQSTSSANFDLGALATATRRFPTRTMFNAVAGVAEDPNAAVPARLGAISLLQSYVLPGIGFSRRDLENPTTGRRWSPVGVSDGDDRDESSEVLGSKTEVISILTRIRDQTSDPRVRNAADQHIRLVGSSISVPRAD
jgi:hypothetical protein